MWPWGTKSINQEHFAHGRRGGVKVDLHAGLMEVENPDHKAARAADHEDVGRVVVSIAPDATAGGRLEIVLRRE
ncbi:hypothetical protein N7540_009794 [Penicillium herquei]|nr:hypothetical protein N7540_009794 [Penicillium herquei]